MIDWKLARVRATELNWGDRGTFLVPYLHLAYASPDSKLGATGQGFGGFVLGPGYTHQWITRCIEVTGAEAWEAIPGSWVWVNSQHDKVLAIKGVVTGIEFRPFDELEILKQVNALTEQLLPQFEGVDLSYP